MSRLTAVLAVCCCLPAILAGQAPTEKGRLGLALTPITQPWTGDLDGMVERRMIRVLTTYIRTQYFIARGTPRGTAYDQGKLLEEELNKKLGLGHLLRQQHIQVLRLLFAHSGRVPAAPRPQEARQPRSSFWWITMSECGFRLKPEATSGIT